MTKIEKQNWLKEHEGQEIVINNAFMTTDEVWDQQGWCPRYAVTAELWDMRPIYSPEYAKKYEWMLDVDWNHLYE